MAESDILELTSGARGRVVQREIIELWHDYKRSGRMDLRDRLLLHYAPLVKYAAARINIILPPHLDHSDLVSYGTFGLIDAIEKYDLTRGLKFETYALARIRGALLDELRVVDWVPRSVRSKIKKIEAANASLEIELLRSPTDAEIAQKCELTEKEVRETITLFNQSWVYSLDAPTGDGDSELLSLQDRLPDLSDESPVGSFEDQSTREQVAEAIRRLPDRHRVVVCLYYFEGLTLAEIGEVLKVTESRVCQIHAQALKELKLIAADADTN